MKTVLFVPGFHENIDSRDYNSVLEAIEAKGYRTKFISIDWRRTTLKNWVSELSKVYNRFHPDDVILAGFSFGAVTTLVAAAKINPHALWLFSLSPYLGDDIRLTDPDQQTLRVVGKNRLDAFRQLDLTFIEQSIECSVILFCGDVERKKWPDIGLRADKSHTKLYNSTLVNVPFVAHKVDDPLYISAIEKAI